MSNYLCYIRYKTPLPSNVRNFTIENATLLGAGKVSVQATWLPPIEVNCVLEGYELCLSKDRLENNVAETPATSFCISNIAVSTLESLTVTHYSVF